MSAAIGLDGLLEPFSRCLVTESARRVLNDGERAEYEALINAADFISILKVKARLCLDPAIQ